MHKIDRKLLTKAVSVLVLAAMIISFIPVRALEGEGDGIIPDETENDRLVDDSVDGQAGPEVPDEVGRPSEDTAPAADEAETTQTGEDIPAEDENGNEEYIRSVLENNAEKDKEPDDPLFTVDEDGEPAPADEGAQTAVVKVRSNGRNNSFDNTRFRVYRNGSLVGEYFFFGGTVYGEVHGKETTYRAGDGTGLFICTAARGDVLRFESDCGYSELKVIRDTVASEEDPSAITVDQEFDITIDVTYPVTAVRAAPALKASGGADEIFSSEAKFKEYMDSIVPEVIENVSWKVVSIDGYDENLGGVWRFQVNLGRIEFDYNEHRVVFRGTGDGTQVSAMCGQMGQGVPPGPVGDSGTGPITRLRYDADNVATFKALFDAGVDSVVIGYSFRFYRSYQDLVAIQFVEFELPLPRNGYLQILKSSANSSVTDGNGCYSLSGTEFQILNGNNVAATVTVKADGTSEAVELPAGTYTVKETKAGKGYRLDTTVKTVTVTAGDTSKVSFANEPLNDPNGVLIYKTDPDTGKRDPQGTGTLGGAEFTVKYYENYDHSGTPAKTWVYKTGGSGFFNFRNEDLLVSGTPFRTANGTIILPLGSYTIQETKAPAGYKINSTLISATVKADANGNAKWAWDGDFGGTLSQQTDGSVDFREGSVIRGGVKFRKIDAETGEPLEGAKISIYNDSGADVVVNGKTVKNGGLAAVIISGSDGIAKTDKDTLPYGRYYAVETEAPGGYTVNSGWKITFSITENDTIIDRTIGNNQLRDQPVRGDLRMLKVNESGEPMANIPFWLIRYDGSGAEAERHVLVTDENGYIDTSAASRSHLRDTNGLDGFVENGAFTDSSKLDPGVGVWFGGAVPDDAKGALPYGRYMLVEIQTEATKGVDLLHTPVIEVTEDTETVVIGDMTNLNVVLSSEARDTTTGTRQLTTCPDAEIQDELSYRNLTPGGRYSLLTLFVMKDDPTETLCSCEQEFTPEEAKGTVTAKMTADTLGLDGRSIVAVDYLYQYIDGNKVLIAEHADPDDEDQTLRIPMMSTTAADGGTEDRVGTITMDGAVTDTIEYVNLVPGQEYVFRGTLIDRETEEAIASVEKTVKPKETDGTVTMPAFEIDTAGYAGKTLVVFEELFIITDEGGEKPVLEHKSLDDEDQTISYPEIGTTAQDKSTGGHTGVVGGESVIVDEVRLANLIPGSEYTVTGKPVYMTDHADKNGIKHDAGDEVEILDGSVKEMTFTAEETEMTVELEYILDSEKLEGAPVVVFEYLIHGETVVAEHADLSDEGQSVHYPGIRTKAADGTTGSPFITSGTDILLIDTVECTDLIPGCTYMVRGALADRDTGEETGYISEYAPFAADMADILIPVTFMVGNGSDLPEVTVVFEDLFFVKEDGTEILIASHRDINDGDQTLYRPEIHTSAQDRDNGTHETEVSKKTVITDRVTYCNLKAGETYTVSGTLMDKDTGGPVIINGKTVTSSVSFKPGMESGTVDVPFVFDSSGLAGKTVVVFEQLAYEDIVVAVHEDIDDEEQSVRIFERPPQIVRTGDERPVGLMICAMIVSGLGVAVTVRKKKKT